MRTIRVYDVNGDFTIEIPDDARITFGYFNPLTGQSDAKPNQYGGFGPGTQTIKSTALRIYTKKRGEGEIQLACFMGVKGFRDSQIKLTRITNKITIEQTLSDDGDGNFEMDRKQTKQLVAVTEPGSYQ